MSAYEILGVPMDASDDTIRAAFRKAARRWHPDRCNAPDAAKRFMCAKKASDELLDPERRRALDLRLKLGVFAAARRGVAKRSAERRPPAKRRTSKPAAAAPPPPPPPAAPGLFVNLAALHARAEGMDAVSGALWIFFGAALDQKLGTANLTPPTP